MTGDYFYRRTWNRFRKHHLGMVGLAVVILYVIVGIYAPFLASSKPLIVQFDGSWYFPLFRYLFYTGFYTKGIDIFFNLLMFTLPAAFLVGYAFNGSRRKALLISIGLLQIGAFLWIVLTPPNDPAGNTDLMKERKAALKVGEKPTWDFDLQYMTPYRKLNMALRYQQRKAQNSRIVQQVGTKEFLPTLWQLDRENERSTRERLQGLLKTNPENSDALSQMRYLEDRKRWLEESQSKFGFELMPLVRSFHWEDDAGGDQALNHKVHWLDLTRINRKDLTAALIFGVRISLVVGILAVGLSLIIGLPIGAFSGYYGGKLDIVVNRLLEIWESMPVLFMLLLVVAIIQSKSIFLVIAVIGLFGWTTITRYIRGEFFKQRNLSYVEACKAIGFPDRFIMFSHILPNAIPPVLTLLPFSIMGAIMSEAALSFLGLGEEGSSSWGVLMDEGRTAFPSESYLLWPPAILLTILLICIALVGDALRDAIDPKSQ